MEEEKQHLSQELHVHVTDPTLRLRNQHLVTRSTKTQGSQNAIKSEKEFVVRNPEKGEMVRPIVTSRDLTDWFA
jgi:hypothetical protein